MSLPFPFQDGRPGTRKMVCNNSEESVFSCMSELVCYVGTRHVIPGATIERPIGWKAFRGFVRSAVRVIRKAKKALASGSGGLEYFLEKEQVTQR